MKLETVSNIEIAPDDSLLVVGLEGGGSPSYQYVYRAAAGVYWDNVAGAFTLDMKNDKRFAHWFAHLSKVLEDEMNVQLHVGGQTAWTNVPNDVRSKIELSNGRR